MTDTLAPVFVGVRVSVSASLGVAVYEVELVGWYQGSTYPQNVQGVCMHLVAIITIQCTCVADDSLTLLNLPNKCRKFIDILLQIGTDYNISARR